MPTYTIAGKTVLITGAAGGIGAAARALQARGANVVLADLGPGAASALARELGGDRALALTVDVTDTAALADAVDRTVDRFGSLEFVDQRVEVGQVGLRLAAEGVRVHVVHSRRPGAMSCSGAALLGPPIVRGPGPAAQGLSRNPGRI
jgi:NADPH:quinone reductase-like Zn-dependent oxidoreductase